MLRRCPPALLSAVVALELASACARDNTETGFTGGGSQSATSSSGSTSTGDSSTSSSGSTSTSSSDSTGTGEDAASTAGASAGTWDVGTSPDFDPTPIGCQGKIDFLFVIDSEFEMVAFQDRLKAAFPDFIDALEQDLADFDYQIMVVDSGGIGLLGDKCYDCEVMMCGACQVPGCPEDYPCGPFVECDVTKGAGVTVVGNFDGSNKRCELATEHRYITTADAATLADSFACMATLGAGPKAPVSMLSMTRALAPDMLNGGCNDGFVRPDALLVVVVMQPSQDTLSPGTPASWNDMLVTVKGGNEEAVVVLVISEDSAQPEGVCPDAGIGDNVLRIFAEETAAHGRFLSSCELDYGPFMTEGAALALDQCAVLVPQ